MKDVRNPDATRHEFAFPCPAPVHPLAALLLACSLPAMATPAENDQAMLKLATDSGCMACHSVLTAPRRADGLRPSPRPGATLR